MNDLFGKEDNGVIFSNCGKYRYALWRIWNIDLGLVMFIGLNPSIADGQDDDPTIRRCRNFVKSWGYGGFYMLNLFTYIATDPKELLTALYPDDGALIYITQYAGSCKIIIFAWGSNKIASEQSKKVIEKFPYAFTLGLNKDGSPKHPLYLTKDTQPIPINKNN